MWFSETSSQSSTLYQLALLCNKSPQKIAAPKCSWAALDQAGLANLLAGP